MILITHIIIALLTIASAIGSVALADRRLIKFTPYLLAGTIISGASLMVVLPGASMMHLCASGLALSVVTMALHRVAVRRLAVV